MLQCWYMQEHVQLCGWLFISPIYLAVNFPCHAFVLGFILK